MTSTVDEDRRREAEYICSDLPPRPLTPRESVRLQTDPDYEVYGVRGHHDRAGETLVTQFVVRFNRAHVLALAYAPNTQWEVVATGEWPADVRRIADRLDGAASPTADWHSPLPDSPE